jgi:hypothetical protein
MMHFTRRARVVATGLSELLARLASTRLATIGSTASDSLDQE